MRARLITAILVWVACASLFAATNEPIYLGIDAKGGRHESKESTGNAPWTRDVTHAERPRPRITSPSGDWYQGVGIFRLRIDPATGATREVTIVRSTGHVVFDRSALLALKLWRWKPGTWTQVDVPMLFQRGGGVLFFPRYTTLSCGKKVTSDEGPATGAVPLQRSRQFPCLRSWIPDSL